MKPLTANMLVASTPVGSRSGVNSKALSAYRAAQHGACYAPHERAAHICMAPLLSSLHHTPPLAPQHNNSCRQTASLRLRSVHRQRSRTMVQGLLTDKLVLVTGESQRHARAHLPCVALHTLCQCVDVLLRFLCAG